LSILFFLTVSLPPVLCAFISTPYSTMAPSPPSSPSAEGQSVDAQSVPASPVHAPRPTLLSSLSAALTADLDEHKFHFLHPRRIPWIQSPLDTAGHEEGGEEHGAKLAREESPEVAPETKTPAVMNKDGSEHHHHHMHLHLAVNPFELAPDEPPLRYQTESSTIQLFYDLFFVANLTTFTAKHDVSDGSCECLLRY
jgi:hypothetical protein